MPTQRTHRQQTLAQFLTECYPDELAELCEDGAPTQVLLVKFYHEEGEMEFDVTYMSSYEGFELVTDLDEYEEHYRFDLHHFEVVGTIINPLGMDRKFRPEDQEGANLFRKAIQEMQGGQQ